MKPPGATVELAYDCNTVVLEGDVVETLTGRRYLVDQSHRVTNRGRCVDPKFPFSWALICIVMGEDDQPPAGSSVHPFVWYQRTKRQS